MYHTNQDINFLFKDSKILICSDKRGFRKWIANLMMLSGIEESMIFYASNSKEVNNVIQKKAPEIILSDDLVDNNIGENLKKFISNMFPNYFEERIFILFTQNISDSLMYQASENEVDAIVIQPAKLSSFKTQIGLAIQKKKEPNNYFKSIKEAQRLIQTKSFDQAIEIIKSIPPEIKAPVMAHYLLGQIHIKNDKRRDAIKSLNTALMLNQSHFKSLTSLYECQTYMGFYGEAYSTYLKILLFYPQGNARYIPYFKTTILSSNFKDLIQKTDDLLLIYGHDKNFQKALGLALYLSAKYFFLKSDNFQACIAIKKTLESLILDDSVLLKIIELYSDNNLKSEAREALELFSYQDDRNKYFSTAKLIILSNSMNDVTVAKEGMRLLEKRIEHQRIYEITINALTRLERYKLAKELSFEMSLRPEPALK